MKIPQNKADEVNTQVKVKAAEKFGVRAYGIMEEVGKRQAIAGQEDWIIDVAVKLAEKKIILMKKN